MSSGEAARRAREAMRRFIRARWEENDTTLFLTSRPPRTRKAPVSTPPVRRAAPAWGGGSYQAPAARPPAQAAAQPRPQAYPPARAAASGGGAVPRHASGMLSPESTEKGKAMLALWERSRECQKCPLGRTRIRFVFGMGRPDSPVVFVGEAPGEQEDHQGLPFVGAAGKLFDKVLEELGMHRDRFFICNVLKCRPPGNRNPQPDEMEECEPYLFEQLKLVAPKYVVALGKFAAQSVLRTTSGIGELRGRWHRLRDFEVLPTYHPAAACRTAKFRDVLKGDLGILKKRLEG